MIARAYTRMIALSPMFDSADPEMSGSLAAESFAATVENVRPRPTRGDMRRLNEVVAIFLDRVSGVLPDLGFDPLDVARYRRSTVVTFNAAFSANASGFRAPPGQGIRRRVPRDDHN